MSAFAALRVGLLDLDDDPELRRPSRRRCSGEELLVLDDAAAPVDAERVADAGDQEEQRDPRVDEQVRQRVRQPVPGPVGEQQRALVENAHEPCRVAARRHIEPAVRPAGRDADERRALDELARQVVQAVGELADDDLGRNAADELAKLVLARDRPRGHALRISATRPEPGLHSDLLSLSPTDQVDLRATIAVPRNRTLALLVAHDQRGYS